MSGLLTNLIRALLGSNAMARSRCGSILSASTSSGRQCKGFYSFPLAGEGWGGGSEGEGILWSLKGTLHGLLR